jgi:predicted alpha-1,2-mannosidase
MSVKSLMPMVAAYCVAAQIAFADAPSLTSEVNPFIGTGPNPEIKVGWAFDTGNVFPGAVCPQGMLAWSPDTTNANHIAGGYWYPDSVIEDFSLTHFSGRGVVCLKEIGFMPIAKEVTASPSTNWETYAATYSHQNESASPGYYRVKFDDGIETELTASPRTGMARFSFPSASPACLLIRTVNSISEAGTEVTGYKTAHSYKVYFVAQFDRPFQSVKTWNGDAVGADATASGDACGAILEFSPAAGGVVQARVGISYVSIDNARANLTAENLGRDFTALKAGAEKAWNDKLSRIQVEGGTPDEKHVFYTALYHCFMHPNILEDVNGQYPGMDGQVHSAPTGHHQYQNIPAWDQHRSHTALMALLAGDVSSDVMQSLVNYAQQDAAARPMGGGLPRWEQVNFNSGGMVGDGPDSMIATAYAFGARDFDTKTAFAAMDKGASVPSTTSDGHKVRDGLKEFQTLGYVPASAAITQEYCSDDFALSQFARAMGDETKAAAYQQRAQNWKNLFDPSTGYIRPRAADGSWLKDFVPKKGKGFIEGSAAQYLWLENFNFKALIDKLGGNAQAIARLDAFFLKTNAGMSSEQAYMGNEPCEETPWVYDFAGAPSRTQAVVRRIQTELFTNQPSGIPGNDDAGAISSWYVFSALGIYPVIPGVAGFVVGSPVFTKATIHRQDGTTIEIIGNNAADQAPYVQSMKINGQACESPWIPWSLLSKGGTLDFDLGDKPSQWGASPDQAPPSFDAK